MRRYSLQTHRNGRPVDPEDVPIVVILDFDESTTIGMLFAKAQLNGHLLAVAKAASSWQHEWLQFTFKVQSLDPETGQPDGRERFWWHLPDPPEERR
jgi:hypothetical protein